jgi:hypothetical protein
MPDNDNTSRKLGYHHDGTKTECAAARTDLVHTCYYGSECINASNNYGLLDRYCDCDTAETLVAGLMCQYKATSICTVDGDNNNIEQVVTDQYCVNDGQCISLVGNGESHPGCICEAGVWEGIHCEYAHGTLLDDALDLFQQRKAGIVVETRGDIPMTPTLADTKTTTGGDGSLGMFDELSNELGVPLILIVGMFIAVLTVIPLSVIAIRMSRKIQQRQDDDADYQSVISFTSSSSTKGMEHVPSDVFMTSRKKKAESSDDDDNNSMMLTPGTQDDLDEETCDVEMLDAETSRMIEAQFEHCGDVDCDRESLELEVSNEGTGSVSLYSDNNMKPASQLLRRRIAISCGKSSIHSKLQSKLSPKIDNEECSIESEVSGSDESTNQICGVAGGRTSSVDGDDLDEGVHFV